MPFECFVHLGYFGTLVLRTLGPLLLMSVLAVVGKLLSRWAKAGGGAVNVLESKKNILLMPSKKKLLAQYASSGWFYVLFLVCMPICDSNSD